MTQKTAADLSAQILDALSAIEKHTRECFALTPKTDPRQLSREASYDDTGVDLPYNLKLLRKRLSNHGALQHRDKLASLQKAMEVFIDIVAPYLALPDENYVPHIQLNWQIRHRSGVYSIAIDSVLLNPKLVSPQRFADSLAAALLRHAQLKMSGECHVYRAANLPTHGRIYVDISAPSEGMVLARIGALLNQNVTQIFEARQGAVAVTRADIKLSMKDEARKALNAIGISETAHKERETGKQT